MIPEVSPKTVMTPPHQPSVLPDTPQRLPHTGSAGGQRCVFLISKRWTAYGGG